MRRNNYIEKEHCKSRAWLKSLSYNSKHLIYCDKKYIDTVKLNMAIATTDFLFNLSSQWPESTSFYSDKNMTCRKAHHHGILCCTSYMCCHDNSRMRQHVITHICSNLHSADENISLHDIAHMLGAIFVKKYTSHWHMCVYMAVHTENKSLIIQKFNYNALHWFYIAQFRFWVLFKVVLHYSVIMMMKK